jgi:hypothetical protein
MELQDIITAAQLHDNQDGVFEDILTSNAPKVIIYEGQPSLVLLDVATCRAQVTRLVLLEKIMAGRKDVEAGRVIPIPPARTTRTLMCPMYSSLGTCPIPMMLTSRMSGLVRLRFRFNSQRRPELIHRVQRVCRIDRTGTAGHHHSHTDRL